MRSDGRIQPIPFADKLTEESTSIQDTMLQRFFPLPKSAFKKPLNHPTLRNRQVKWDYGITARYTNTLLAKVKENFIQQTFYAEIEVERKK